LVIINLSNFKFVTYDDFSSICNGCATIDNNADGKDQLPEEILSGMTADEVDGKNANKEDDKNNISTTKFLEYQIIRGYPFNRTFLEDYRSCAGPDREELHENFQKPGILDFHTVIHTNLHILYIGSSIAMQLSQGFQEATQSAKREVIRYVRYRLLDMHENTHITRTEDGGTVGALRLTGLFEHRTRDKKRWVAPQGGGGWFSSDVREMKRMIHQWREQDSLVGKANSNSSCEVVNDESVDNRTASEMILCEEENFDALVYQIPVRITLFSTNQLPLVSLIACITRLVRSHFLYLLSQYVGRMATRAQKSGATRIF